MQAQIAKLIRGEDLTAEEMTAAFQTIMEGQATDAQIGGFLVALAIKGETVEEIAAAAQVMRAKVTPILAPADRVVLDTCGTGGDRMHTFNISTAAAIIAAASGATVAKHGNRSVTSACGSAEVLAELGVNVQASVATVQRCVAEANIGFCFAPLLHGAMKYAVGPRKQLAVRTIFNILGPLTNPASARRQVLGVFSRALTGTLAQVLGRLGSQRAMVVHGSDGLDEITLTGPTHVAEWVDGGLKEYDVTPADFGVSPIRLADIQVNSPAESAAMIRDVLAGKGGPASDIACVNAAAACHVAGRAADPRTGVTLCREVIAAGAAARTLELLARLSNEPAK
jgi:anthranilate phosphoribosyltransferase